jgi:hypothetical protein
VPLLKGAEPPTVRVERLPGRPTCKMTPSRCCSASATLAGSGAAAMQNLVAAMRNRGFDQPLNREGMLQELTAVVGTHLEGESGKGVRGERRCLGKATRRNMTGPPTDEWFAIYGACDNSDVGRGAAPSWASG